MTRATGLRRLSDGLGLGRREMVALVGAGGKTTLLHRLAAELADAGRSVIVTTTTAMREDELQGLGPVVMERDAAELEARVRGALADGPVAAAARGPAPGGKVAGLEPATADALWHAGLADHVLVEADGSRGRPFKAFAQHEPQVPALTTTVVQMAGLDALGRPLGDDVVHRAQLLSEALKVPLGAPVTPQVFADGLGLQIGRLRRAGESMRIVTVLNKLDACADEDEALELAHCLAGPPAVAGKAVAPGSRHRPDAVVLASLRDGRFTPVDEDLGGETP